MSELDKLIFTYIFDALKTVTTLNTALLVLLFTLVEKIFKKPRAKSFIISCVIFSALSLLASGIGLATTPIVFMEISSVLTSPDTATIVTPIPLIFSFVLSYLFFLLSVFSFAAFGLANFIIYPQNE